MLKHADAWTRFDARVLVLTTTALPEQILAFVILELVLELLETVGLKPNLAGGSFTRTTR